MEPIMTQWENKTTTEVTAITESIDSNDLPDVGSIPNENGADVNETTDTRNRPLLSAENNSNNNSNNNACNESDVMITLISNDQRTFHVPLEATKLSGFIVVTLGIDEDDDDDDDDAPLNHKHTYEPIVIPRVNGIILQKIVDFLLHYHYKEPMPKIQQPITGDTFEENMMDGWYQEYIVNEEKDTIFRILEAANFMEISPIIDLTCLWCTFQISGKSTEEIRVLLNLPKMTPEEETQAREDHPWIFESITPP